MAINLCGARTRVVIMNSPWSRFGWRWRPLATTRLLACPHAPASGLHVLEIGLWDDMTEWRYGKARSERSAKA
jgi:hypothetical protein